MTKWLLFSSLWWVTGNPLLALMIIFLGAWAVDHLFVGLLPSPLRRLRAFLRRRELERCVEINPADGNCLLELGRNAVERWQHRQARPYLERALERMPLESEARYLLGIAEIGCQDTERGLRRIRELLAEQPRYRHGEPWLEVGARLLKNRQHAEAVEVLQGFLRLQPTSVRGNYLLAIALAKRGDKAAARAARRRAWEEYLTSPGFRQRQDRRYAWRANPRRPLFYGSVASAVVLGVAILIAVNRPAPAEQARGDATVVAPHRGEAPGP